MRTHRTAGLGVVALLLCAIFARMDSSPLTAALLTDGRDQAVQDLHDTINQAVDQYRSRSGAQNRLSQAQKAIAAHEERILTLERENRAVRLRIGELRADANGLKQHYVVEMGSPDQMHATLVRDTEAVGVFVRQTYLRRMVAVPLDGGALFPLLTHALGNGGDHLRRTLVLQDALANQMGALSAGEDVSRTLADLEKRHAEIQSEIAMEEGGADDARQQVAASKTDLAEIQREVEDVHQQVIALQDHLHDINDRIRQRAADALIARGLLDPSVKLEAMHAASPLLHWPVVGRFTAGFGDSSYKAHFGVPHRAQDIAVPQESAVHAAADGIVFLVRDGGLRGYTYVLIGHADGFATLYGHLSAVMVSAGQEVQSGDPIGLSGGTPGTQGAGPMTTGPHVHFEVIKDGVNIDPKSVIDS